VAIRMGLLDFSLKEFGSDGRHFLVGYIDVVCFRVLLLQQNGKQILDKQPVADAI
jgi:hypothetical protein